MLLLCILFSTIIFLGCSTVIFGPLGSIEVTTNPSGANIFLNGEDTGKETPFTFTNIPNGNYVVEVVLLDTKYSEVVYVEDNQTTNVYVDFDSQVILEKITVLPSYTTITLSLGNTTTINSVTSYYSNYSSINIPLINCTYNSSNKDCATVNSNGTITGISAGTAIIIVSYTEGEITETDTVLVYIRNTPTDISIIPPVQDNIEYHALLVGVGDYKNDDGMYVSDLDAPPFDVGRMLSILNQCKFGSGEVEFSLINSLKDLSATKTAILNGITSTFAGADDDDISYFYFSGHGYLDPGTNVSYLCPTDTALSLDLSTMISVNELESHLSAIKGIKVVILDSCNSGGFIGKGEAKIGFNFDNLVTFNNSIVNVFSTSESKDLLTSNQYKVLTSCHYNEPSVEFASHQVDGNPFGLFTAAFCKGCGYDDGTYYADSDDNTKVILHEAYSYIKSTLISYEQDVQVSPTNSSFTIIEY